MKFWKSVVVVISIAFLPTTVGNVAFAADKKPTFNYFRMSKDQFAEYSKLYSAGNVKSKNCHLEYLNCWEECIPGCGIGAYGQLVNCSSCYTTEQRCGKPELVCDPETGTQPPPKPSSGEYWTGEMESRQK